MLIGAKRYDFKKLLLSSQHSKTKRLIYSDKWQRKATDPHIQEAGKNYWNDESIIKKTSVTLGFLHVHAEVNLNSQNLKHLWPVPFYVMTACVMYILLQHIESDCWKWA